MDNSTVISWWENLRVIWAGLGLGLAAMTGLVVWRVRGLLVWKRSQREELAELRRSREQTDTAGRQALDHIIATCETLWNSTSLDLSRLTELPDYVRRIAACYFPEESHPEMCLSVGRLLSGAHQLADRLETLLRRPGFKRLGKLRLRQLQQIYYWYQRFNEHPAVGWIIARWGSFRIFRHALRFALPDPIVWVAYLSQRLTVMMALRCVLIDIYLFAGKSAIEAFDAQRQSKTVEVGSKTAQGVIDTFEIAVEKDSPSMPEEIEAIRNDLTALPRRLWKPPDVHEWSQAVEKAARAIAADYFPESEQPLHEATCHVLLERSRYWLQAMADARRMPVVRPVYGISLKRLHQIKTIGESDLIRRTGKVTMGVWSVWRWARWPIKALRWARRRSPAGVAVEVGITLSLKAMQNYLARYGFDRACQELDIVYRLSSSPEQNRASDKDQPPVESTPSD